MRQLFPLYLKRWRWIFAAVAIPPIALSFFNLNFVYVALMLVFFALPTLLGTAYFYYSLSDECLSSIRKGRMIMKKEGIVRQYMDDEDGIVSAKHMQWADFDNYYSDKAGLKLFLKNSRITFEYVPSEAFEDNNFLDVVALVSKHLPVREK